MKKVFALMVVFALMTAAIPSFAQAVAEDVLLEVKSKIDLREDLTEFSYTENKYDDVLRYDFTWQSEDGNREMYVSADKTGEIVTYSYYEWGQENEKGLIDYTLNDARDLAQSCVRRLFPKYFENGKDTLRLDEKSVTSRYYGRYKRFSFTFDRFYEDERAESNFVYVTVKATKDAIYVQEVNSSLDNDTKFNDGVKAFSDDEKEAKYEEKFPITLFYMTDYSDEDDSVKLYYKTEKGFVSYETGEIAEQKDFDRYVNTSGADAEALEAGSSLKNDRYNGLSEKEQSEIDKMETLVTSDAVEKKLRGLKLLKITDDMKNTSSYRYAEDGKYFVRFSLEGDERVMNVTYNGETGEVVGIYSYYKKYDDAEKEENAADMPKDAVEELVRALAGDKADEVEKNYDNCSLVATRLVNGIEFPENKIRVTYNKEKDAVTYYSITWRDDENAFANPKDAMSLETAREIIYDDGFAENVWVKSEDGYVRAVTVDALKVIDAVNGKMTYDDKTEKKLYTDIESHWVKTAAEVLWEHDIYFDGDMLAPDEKITLADMLRLFAACRNGSMLSRSMTDERVIEYAKEEKYITDANATDTVTRREAFRVMTAILGYGEISGFDIYKSSYTDAPADGNAEILKAMGVLVGNEARMDDCLTRGEAVVMVYRYLKK